MKKQLSVVALAAVIFLSGYLAGRKPLVVHAQPVSTASVPASWGSCKGAWHDYLLFEAADGTVRAVNIYGEVSSIYKRQ